MLWARCPRGFGDKINAFKCDAQASFEVSYGLTLESIGLISYDFFLLDLIRRSVL